MITEVFSIFIYFRYIFRSGIVESYDSSIFNFLRKLHTAFYRGWPFTRVSFSLAKHRLSLIFLLIAILSGVRWYLIFLVLICIPLMISDVKYIFMCLLSICIYSLGKCLFRSSVNFLFKLSFFCCYDIWVFNKSLPNTQYANFSHAVGCLFILLIFFFFCAVFHLMQSH